MEYNVFGKKNIWYIIKYNNNNKINIICYLIRQIIIPILPCNTKYYSKNTKYYSAIQKTFLHYKILLRITKNSSVLQILHQDYKLLLQYQKLLLRTTKVDSLLHKNAPLLFRTTKYYSVLQNFTPILLSTAKYYSVL